MIFFIHDGKPVQAEHGTGDSCADMVLKYCETLPDNENFKVYFNNYFTTFEFQKRLKQRKIWSIGTVRVNRLQGCPLVLEKCLKRDNRGFYDYRMDLNSHLTVVRWYDNRAVHISSTHCAIEPLTTIRRWDRKQKQNIDFQCPEIISEYNEHMGGALISSCWPQSIGLTTKVSIGIEGYSYGFSVLAQSMDGFFIGAMLFNDRPLLEIK